MIRPVERDEAFWMLGGLEQPRCMIDPDHGVERRMHDEQWAQRRHALLDIVVGYVVDERAPNVEGASAEVDVGLALSEHAIERCRLELVQHVLNVGGCRDRGDCSDSRNASGRRDRRGSE